MPAELIQQASEHLARVEMLFGELPRSARVAAQVGADPLDSGERLIEARERDEALAGAP